MRKKKLVCKYGHEIATVGRVGSNCGQCYRNKYPHKSKEFCQKGHEKAIVGIDTRGRCKQCRSSNIKIRDKKRRERKLKIIRQFKSKPCMDCQIPYPSYIMEFDHREPSKKNFTIGEYGASGSSGIQRLLNEIAKCDVVCANCHRERTQKQILNRRKLCNLL